VAEWERVVTSMDDMNLSGLFVHARLIGWSDQAVELGFARGSLHAERAKDSNNITKLKTILATLTGQPFDVKVKEIAHMPPPAAAPGASAAAPPNGSANGHANGHAASGEPSPSATVAELEHERRRAERERRESEARQHPLTKAAIDTFGATIKEIKVDG
jgi:hypothetical protein